MINLIFEICKKGRRGQSEICFDRKSLHCNFKKGGSSTTVQSYQPTPEERRLMDQAANYSEAVMPNALRLNDTARDLLWDSIGSNQVDFNTLNSNAQNRIASVTGGLTDMIGANTAATDATNAQLGTYTPQFQTATDTANGVLGALTPQYQNATNAANSALGAISPQYMSVANAANGTLGSLANGVLPTAYQANMENAIRSGLEKTMGNTVNNLGQRGVLNSSVTNSAMNDISKNAADTVAQHYQQNIGQVGDLTQQQLGNINTALGAQTALEQQRFDNTSASLGAQGEIAQQQLGNTNNSLESQLGVSQNQLSNTMNTNQFNAGLLGNLLESASAPITVAAAAQEAAQQPALNLWNASMGLNQGGTGTALAGVSGKGTTTSTTNQSGGFWSGAGGVLGGLASGWASAWCFAEDTLVKMADGTAKHIQDVVKGDKVLCPHVDGTESVEEVLDVMEPHFADVYAVTATDDKGDYRVVLATSTQPILCEDGTFVTVGNMKPHKRLRDGLQLVSVEYDEFCPVYDLKVSGENNYYADGFVAKGGTNEW